MHYHDKHKTEETTPPSKQMQLEPQDLWMCQNGNVIPISPRILVGKDWNHNPRTVYQLCLKNRDWPKNYSPQGETLKENITKPMKTNLVQETLGLP